MMISEHIRKERTSCCVFGLPQHGKSNANTTTPKTKSTPEQKQKHSRPKQSITYKNQLTHESANKNRGVSSVPLQKINITRTIATTTPQTKNTPKQKQKHNQPKQSINNESQLNHESVNKKSCCEFRSTTEKGTINNIHNNNQNTKNKTKTTQKQNQPKE